MGVETAATRSHDQALAPSTSGPTDRENRLALCLIRNTTVGRKLVDDARQIRGRAERGDPVVRPHAKFAASYEFL